ncbi:hypothetical protein SAMD00019534_084000 [Acytostelium subglobosum LB1]|uniref:hypothetical protein n=1 Tax=Acytostelium subglobosum LB1 TaxID=1410327 RepID=UPI0006450733|nr:hypothetical protein SAMD00019534_084000 [Acytostelium subglobosum LB1]GAM25225.1 hypothetical protein SAMD00019534_084000 [Acytostelium subglobosum LB1]|eukprot:XP_012751745.1 hypothetical protein SAMD00019534_084000 [Acytostelium subglobosum LB1]
MNGEQVDEDEDQDEDEQADQEEEEGEEEEEEEQDEEEQEEEDRIVKKFNLRPRETRPLLKRLFSGEEEEEERYYPSSYQSRTRTRASNARQASSSRRPIVPKHVEEEEEEEEEEYQLKTRTRLVKRPRFLIEEDVQEVIRRTPTKQYQREIHHQQQQDLQPTNLYARTTSFTTPITKRQQQLLQLKQQKEEEEEEDLQMQLQHQHQQQTGQSPLKTRRSLNLSDVNVSSFLTGGRRGGNRFQKEASTNKQSAGDGTEDVDDCGKEKTQDIDIETGDNIEEARALKEKQIATRGQSHIKPSINSSSVTRPNRARGNIRTSEMEQHLPPSNSRRVRIPTSRFQISDTPRSATGSRSKPLMPTRANWRMGTGGGGNGREVNSDSESDTEPGWKKRRGITGPLPINLNEGSGQEQQQPGDTEPVSIDSSVTFHSVGGLDGHIRLLKEMLVLPLVYPEVFSKFKIQPPKGVLFYGPPGTGKTLLARALVNECNLIGKQGQKVSFFMRKGADCLSKWVGEAERQLRMLFEQAKSMQPSIIFFDEIDGLAPVRSSRQDHIHSSMVSTLLALMDGLDNRGQVIVIGATNRIDSIDPALRRPGRFDRELLFTLPNKAARRKILQIHTEQWQPPLDEHTIDTVADLATGYCGADIKALTSESVLVSLRKTYPQIYESTNKLLLEIDSIKVTKGDFLEAMQAIVPSSKRSIQSFANPLSRTVRPLLEHDLDQLLQTISHIFPIGHFARATSSGGRPETTSIANYQVYRPRLLICGEKDQAQVQLGNALLYHLEEFPVFSIDICTLLADPVAKSIDESCCRALAEAKKISPSILYLPNIDRWWGTSESLPNTLVTYMANIDPNHPLLILATIEQTTLNIPEDIINLFSCRDDSIYSIQAPNKDAIHKFYQNILLDIKDTIHQLIANKRCALKTTEKLPIVQMVPDEARDKKKDRQLRILLREILSKIINDRRYYSFFRDVNIEQFPEYYDLIKNPMSISAISKNLENHKYLTVSSFLKDIDLIVTNTIEYYQVHDPNGIDGTKATSRAKQLQDEVYAMMDQVNPTLIQTCENIAIKRGRNYAVINEESHLHDTSVDEEDDNNNNNNSNVGASGGVTSPVNDSRHTMRSARLRGEASEITKEMMDSFMRPVRRKRVSAENSTHPDSTTDTVENPIVDCDQPTQTDNENIEMEDMDDQPETTTTTTTTTTSTTDSGNDNDEETPMQNGVDHTQDHLNNNGKQSSVVDPPNSNIDAMMDNERTNGTPPLSVEDHGQQQQQVPSDRDPDTLTISSTMADDDVSQLVLDEEWFKSVDSDDETNFINAMIQYSAGKTIENLIATQSKISDVVREIIVARASNSIAAPQTFYQLIIDSVRSIFK